MIVAGVMSGTSADGINVALVRIAEAPANARNAPGVSFRLLGHAESPYPKPVRREVLRLMNATSARVADLARLNFFLGDLYAEAVLRAQKKFHVAADLVGCHGQTLFHQGIPEAYLGRKLSATWQTGEGAVIAASGGVVADGPLYERMLASAHSIWLKATPEEHMNRVMVQGDLRPMASNRSAMADLKGKIVLVKTTPGGASTTAREDGFRDGLKAKYPAIEILDERYGMASVAQSLTVMENMLTAHPDLDGIFCSNESGTSGAAQGCQSRSSQCATSEAGRGSRGSSPEA